MLAYELNGNFRIGISALAVNRSERRTTQTFRSVRALRFGAHQPAV